MAGKESDVSAFLEKKARAFFKIHDFNKDGVLTENDFTTMADTFSDREGADPARREVIRKCLREFWKEISKSLGGRDNEPLTEEVLVRSWKNQVNNPKTKTICVELAHGFLEALDTNNDGFLQSDEFRRLFDSIGFPDVEGFKIAFEAIDENQDGKLSKDETTNAFVHYMTSDDESSPFKNFYGPFN